MPKHLPVPSPRKHGWGFKSYSLRKLEEAIGAYNAFVDRTASEEEEERPLLDTRHEKALGSVLERFGQWKENNPREYANREGGAVETAVRAEYAAFLHERGVDVDDHATRDKLASTRFWYLATQTTFRVAVPRVDLTKQLFSGDGGLGVPFKKGDNKDETTGEFKPLVPAVVKYGKPRVFRYRFVGGSPALVKLRAAYRDVEGEPGFMHTVHHLDRHEGGYEVPKMAAYVDFPFLYCTGPGFTLVPHTTYNDLQGLGRDPLSAKHRDGGVSYLLWFTHPDEIDGAVNDFTPQTYERTRRVFERQTLGRTRSFYRPGRTQVPEHPPGIKRTGSQKKIGAIEASSRTKYLASILDFTYDDLDYLKLIREAATTHMQEIHGYDPSDGDDLRLYFHFPYDDLTTTMHLHVRLNQGRVGLEETKSFYLDDIIRYFERTHNETIYDLILSREKIYWPRVLERVKDINKNEVRKLLDISEVDNPHPAPAELLDAHAH